jgi:hypothetical protein
MVIDEQMSRKMGLWMQESQMELNLMKSCRWVEGTVFADAKEMDWVGQLKGEVAHKPDLLHTGIGIPCSAVSTPCHRI